MFKQKYRPVCSSSILSPRHTALLYIKMWEDVYQPTRDQHIARSEKELVVLVDVDIACDGEKS